MEIKEIKKRKKVLCDAIQVLTERFESDTGVRVDSIHISDEPGSKILCQHGMADNCSKIVDVCIVIE